MKDQETQTESNESNHSSFKLKRLRKTRAKEATRDQTDSVNTSTKEKPKEIWRVYSRSPPTQGQVAHSAHHL
jgi:hypothetical protein